MRIYAERIREAQTGAIDTGKLAEAWAALHPGAFGEPAAAKAVSPALAAFLAAAARALRDALRAVLGDLWAEGWVLGQLAAQAVTAGTRVDWRGWTPADHDAARQIAGDGLQRLLADADIRIQSIAQSRVGELADVLENALASDVREIEPYHKPPGVWSMQDVLPARNSIGDLAAKLENVLDNPARAKMVAHTEMARAQSAATLESYGETGVREKSWLTAEDGKVCPVCDANEAAGVVAMGSPFPSGGMAPPGHPMCFPGGVIVTGPSAVAATARHYEGDLLTIVLAGGQEVPVTPNHPVLTLDGWVAAGDLHEGAHVLRAADADRVARLVCPDDRQAVARIEDVAGALAEAGAVASLRMPVAAEDFHGDGSPGHDVQVVRAARHAVGDVVAEAGQQVTKSGFVAAEGAPVLGDGDPDAGLRALLAPEDREVGGAEHGRPLAGAGVLPADAHGLAAAADVDAGFAEHPLDGPAAGAVPASERLHRLAAEVVPGEAGRRGQPAAVLELASAGQGAVQRGDADAGGGRALADALSGAVGTERVIELRRVNWSGHVYNLETVSGWYFANGIIAHNCRCALMPVVT